jgi:lipid II:glycine glycyltransferase (peptidoglycan interpeptide bridge formation enzyme)
MRLDLRPQIAARTTNTERHNPQGWDQQDWDQSVEEAPHGHLLQSYGWGELKDRHGWSVQRVAVRSGSATAAAQLLWRKTPIGCMGYVSRGPAISPPGHEEVTTKLIDALHQEARARGAVFLKIEPNSADADLLPALGFLPSPHTVQPRVTLVLDLNQDLETLMDRQLEKTRYNIRLAAKKGVTVRIGHRGDIEAFSSLMKETGTRNGFQVRTAAYYRDAFDLLGDRAELLVAEHDGDLLSAMLLTMFNGEATYLFGGSTSYKRNLMASHLIQWEAIKRAKERGMKCYDFWAIPRSLASTDAAGGRTDGSASQLPPAEDTSRGDLWGVYRFKRGFGGTIRTYSGAYDYVYDQRRYWLWHQLLPHALSVLRRGSAQVELRLNTLRRL